ncbi:MAG TPA: hypothetical protein VLA19_15300 [Herpetosiphonaceae bacterium]|nr:hypothetical protein [Herpetosiphonaceae bacterium]
MLKVSVDSLGRACELAEQTDPAFPVLSDPDPDATVAHDIFEDGIAPRHTPVIDWEGTVHCAYIGEDVADLAPFYPAAYKGIVCGHTVVFMHGWGS